MYYTNLKEIILSVQDWKNCIPVKVEFKNEKELLAPQGAPAS